MLRFIKALLLIMLLFGILKLIDQYGMNGSGVINAMSLMILNFFYIIREFFIPPGFTLSMYVTFLIIIIGGLYMAIHLIEMVLAFIAGILKREHRPIYVKHKLHKAFWTLMSVKAIFILVKILILITQAWSISRFLHWFIEHPVDMMSILKTDIVFIVILTILFLNKWFTKHKNENYQYSEIRRS